MVAVVAGNGLGLGNTSLTQLGQAQGGQATIGQGQVGQYVNIATGNLVLQNQDEGLIFDGLSLNVLRTYNSQGQLAGNQGWLFGFTRQVTGLSGQIDTAGSTVTRVDDDGSSVTYTYNASLGAYVSSGQSGTQDTLAWNATTNQWTWTDGSSRDQETYDGNGVLIGLANPDTGAHFTFNYQNGVLSSIVADDGDTLSFSYTNGSLTGLSISEVPPGQSVAVVRQQLSYAYDTQGRLASVTTTLASDTDPNGTSYTTSYTYDGTSNRVASVSQSDGTVVSYTYATDAIGNDRVATVTTGTGAAAQILTLNYTPGSDTTTVTDGLGRSWTYTYDASGRLTQVAAPVVNGASPATRYAYDASGNLLQMTDANGGITYYSYDANGNRLSVQDPAGNVVAYTYNADSQLTSSTTFTVPAQGVPGQTGYVPASGARTTYYVYDASDRLSYVVDALGNVLENDYTTTAGISVLATTRQYLGAQFATSGLSPLTPPALADLQAWAASGAVQATLGNTTRTDYSYDVRGQLATKTQWAAVDANGNGVADTATSVTTTSYDAQGRLLQTSTQKGGVLETTSYAYDGMGRLLSSTDPLGNVTSYLYGDAGNSITVTQANGLVTTQVRNSAGQVVSTVQSGSGMATRTGTQLYDTAGQAVAAIDPLGNVTYTFYDADGRVAGKVDPTGAVTSYTYDADGHVIAGTQYATLVNTSRWIANGVLTSNKPANLPLPVASSRDSHTTTLYDLAGRKVATIDASGDVVWTEYDGAGNAIKTTALANALSTTARATLGDTVTLSTLLGNIAASSSDRVTRMIYDADDRLVATIDPTGAVKTLTYDDAGNVIASRLFTITLSSAQIASLGDAPTLRNVLSLLFSSGETINDANGRPAATVDPQGHVTITTYDAAGHAVAVTAYANLLSSDQLSQLIQTPSLAALESFLAPSTGDRTSLQVYDANGHVVASVDASGVVTTTTYDAAGNATSTTTYTQALTPDVVAGLGTTPTADQIASVVNASAGYQRTLSVYNASNQVVVTVDPTGHVVVTGYDAAGNPVSATAYQNTLNATQLSALGTAPALADVLADVVSSAGDTTTFTLFDDQHRALASVSANGIVTTYTYDATGHVLTSIASAAPLTATQRAALLATPTMDELQALLNIDAGAQTTLTVYDDSNRPVVTVSPAGYVTLSTYDAEGRVIATTSYGTPLSDVQQAALGGAPTLAQVLADVVPGTSDLTSLTVFDAQGRVVGSVSNTGQVTLSIYSANGSVITTTYASLLSQAQVNALGTAPTLSQLQQLEPGGSSDTISMSLLDNQGHVIATVSTGGLVALSQYNDAGQLITSTQYGTPLTSAQLAALGSSPTFAALQAAVTTSVMDTNYVYIYDPQGRLVGTLTPIYAGQNGTYGQLTTTTYSDDGQPSVVKTYSRYLTPDQQAALVHQPTVAELQLLIALSTGGQQVTNIYDANGRVVGTLQGVTTYDNLYGGGYYGSATLTTNTYDAAGHLVSQRNYAQALSVAQVLALGSSPSLSAAMAVVSPNANDFAKSTIYDAQGRVVGSVDNYGDVVTTVYAQDGSYAIQTNYAYRLTSAQTIALANVPTLATLLSLVPHSSYDSVDQKFYDTNGRVVAEVNPSGQVTTTTYTADGLVQKTVAYVSLLGSSQLATLAASPSLATLMSVVTPSVADNVNMTIYDSNDRPVAQVTYASAISYPSYTWTYGGTVSILSYDGSGHLIANRHYAQIVPSAQLQGLGSSPTLAGIEALLTPNLSDSLTVYDTSGNVVASVVNETVTLNTYGANGTQTSSTMYGSMLTADQLTALGNAPTFSAIQALVTPGANDRATRTILDDQGRVVATFSAPTSYYDWDTSSWVYGSQVIVTSYDDAGDATQETQYLQVFSMAQVESLSATATLSDVEAMIDPGQGYASSLAVYDTSHRVIASVDTSGRVTTTTYDAAGNVTATYSYSTALTTSQVDALGNAPTLAALDADLTQTSQDSAELFIYDANGRKTADISSNGIAVYGYDAAGNQTSLMQYSPPGIGFIQSLGNQPSMAALAAYTDYNTPTNISATLYDANERPVAWLATTRVYNYWWYQTAVQLTTATYDASGNLVNTRVSNNTLGLSQAAFLGSNPTLQQVLAAFEVNDYVASDTTIFDASGNMLATVGTYGQVTIYTYANGRMVSSTQYSNRLSQSAQIAVSDTPTMAELTSLLTPSQNDQTYITITDANGNTVGQVNPELYYNTQTGDYDSGGLATIYGVDADGRTTSTTSYTTPLSSSQLAELIAAPTLAMLQSLVTPSSSDAASVTVFDSSGEVLGEVDQNGQVTIYTFDANGNVSATTQYANALTIAQVEALGDAPTIDQLAAAVTPSSSDVTTLGIYDANGNQVGSVGPDGQVEIDQWNANGQWMSAIDYATPLTSAQVASLGTTPRLAELQAMVTPSSADQISFAIYDANGNQVADVENGQVTTTKYDNAGDVLATISYAIPLTTAQMVSLGTSPTLAALQALLTPSAQDTASVTIYDANGNVVGKVAADGTVATTTFDKNGNIIATHAYATPLSWQQIEALAATPTSGKLKGYLHASVADQVSLSIYDTNGNLLATVGPDGQVDAAAYDALGEITAVTHYATKLTPAQLLSLGDTPTMAALQALLKPGASDQNSLTVYDGQGRVIATVGPDGTVTMMRYDAEGRQTATTQWGFKLSALQVSELGTVPTMAALQADLAIDSGSALSQSFYDANGHLLAVIGTDGRVTTSSYDINGNLTSTTQYAVPISASHGYMASISDLWPLLQPNAGDTTTHTVYDAQNRVVATIDATGHVTLTTYDASGQVATTSVTATVLTHQQINQLGGSPTLAQVEAALDPTTQAFYDAAGNQVAVVDAQGNVTYRFYDADGQVTAVVDPMGYVTAYTYDGDGHVVQTTAYALPVSTVGWFADGALTSSFPSTLTLPVATTQDRTPQTVYDVVGEPVATIDGVGDVTVMTYDAAGRMVASTAYAVRLTAAQRTALGSAPSLADLQAVITTNAADRTSRTIYDADDRAVATIDAGGYVTTMTYDGDGDVVLRTAYATALTATQLTALGTTPTLASVQADLVTSAQDQTTRSYYDSLGRLVAQVDADGYLTLTTYNQAARAATQTRYAVALTPLQMSALTGRESSGALLALLGTQPGSQQTTSYYNAEGQVTLLVAADGTRTSYAYDNDGRLLSTTVRPVTGQGTATVTSVTYDANGEVVTSKDANGYTTHNTYDSLGQLTQETDALGNSKWYFYDADGRLAYVLQGMSAGGVANAVGNVTAYQYDAFGEATSKHVYAEQLGLIGYPSGPAAIIDPSVATLADIATAVAALPQPSNPTDVDDVTRTTYNKDGQVATTVDGDGYKTVYYYDAFGDLVETARQLSAPGSAISEANDTVTRYGYDTRGDRTIEIDGYGSASASTSRVTYDAFGRVARTIDGNGAFIDYSYDNLGRQVTTSQVVQGVARSTQTAYDAFDRVVTQTDALGNVTQYQYVLATHTTTTTSPEGVVLTVTKDAYGNTVSVADGAGNTVSYTYDRDGNLLTTTDAMGQVSSNKYNALDELISTTSASGLLVTYSYDAAGRVLLRRVDPNGLNQVTRYSYDGEGRQLTVTDPTGVTTSYAYDADGNVLTQTQTASALSQVTSFTYDGEGNILTATTGVGTDEAVTTAYTYDAQGRLVQKVLDPNGLAQVTGYAYDADGHLVETTDPAGNSSYTIYNQAGEVVYSATPGGAEGAGQVALTQNWYDADGRLVSTRNYGNVVDASTLAGLSGNTANANLALCATLAKTAVSSADQISYRVYDADGHVRYTIDPAGNVTEYRYNSLGQMAETLAYATPVSVGALATSLRAGTAGSSDVAQLLTTAGDTDSTARVTYSYYDADGRVAFSVTQNLVNGVLAAVASANTYDAAGRVTASIVYGVPLLLSQVGGAATTASIAAAVAAVNSPDTTRTTQYVYNAVGQQVAEVDPNGNVTYTFYDADNRVVATVDPSGAVVQYKRDGFGRVVRETAYNEPATTAGWLVNNAVTVRLSDILPASDMLNDRVTITNYDALGRVATVTRYSAAQDNGSWEDINGDWEYVPKLAYTDGDRLTYTYDAASNVVETVDVDLSHTTATRTTRYFYDADGNRVATLDADGYLSTTTYDAAGHISQTTGYATATVATLRTDGSLQDLLPAASANDKTTHYYYDGLDNLVGELDADGYFTQYSYDRDGRQAGTTRYADVVPPAATGSLASIQEAVVGMASQRTTCQYDAYGDRISERNAEGTVTSYAYDADGRLIQTVVALGTTDARSSTETYDAFGNLASSTDGLGNTTTYAYDLDGNRTSVTDALGNTTWYVYDANGRQIFSIQGRTDENGDKNALGAVTNTQYDTYGDVIQTIEYDDLMDVPAGFAPDPGNMSATVETLSAGFRVYYGYDLEGNLIFKEDGNGNQFDSSFDGFNELVVTGGINYNDSRTVYKYDGLGHIISQLDGSTPEGSAAFAMVASSGGWGNSGGQFSLLREQDWTYDAFGRMATYTDGDGATTSFSYDGLDRQLTQSLTVQGQLRETSTSYDAYGRIVSKTDAMGLVTTYAYIDAQRSVTVTSPGGVTTTTTHNREGQTVSIKDSSGQFTRYSYDADGRLLQTANPDGSVASSQYDADGNRTLTTDADGHAVAYTYDADGRVLTQTVDPNGLKLVTTYLYNGRGLAVTEVDPNGVETDYSYDGNGNLSQKIVDAGQPDAIQTWYYYNDRNEVTATELYRSLDNQNTDIYDNYDALGRLVSEGGDTGVATINYTYDADGNVIEKVVDDYYYNPNETKNTYYFYDEAGELVYSVDHQGSSSMGWTGGAVTRNWYNANGQIVASRNYATAINENQYQSLESLDVTKRGGLDTALNRLQSMVHTSGNDQTSYSVYNASGQLQFSIDPTGVVTETRYNAAGQASETLVYAHAIAVSSTLSASLLAGTATVAGMQSALTAANDTDATARTTRMFYDDRGRVEFTISSASANGTNGGAVTQMLYDADGNLVEQVQYGSLIPLGRLGSTATTASIASYMATITDQRVTHYAYDAAGRQVYTVDALGDVTETRYDGDGRVTWTLQYANAIATPSDWSVSSIAVAVQAANPSSSQTRGVGKVYDAFGNVTQTLDTLSSTPVATYTYNVDGRKATYTNRDGETWSYQYDYDGRLSYETSPPVAVASYSSAGVYLGTTQQSITTYYDYDSSGNLDQVTVNGVATQYVYDSDDHLLRTTGPQQGNVAPSTGLVVTGFAQSVVITTYNALGQAVVAKDASGNYSYQAYDLDGRLAYSVDADGYVTGYRYNAYGEQIGVTRYSSPIDTSVLTNWSPGQAMSLQQVRAAVVTSPDDRAITTTYDAQGNKLSVTQPATTYTNSDGTTATGSPVTRYTYDAYGDVTSQSVLVQGTPGQAGAVWATTYTYYDALGRKTMTVDPMGYATTWSYDAFGDVVSTTEWATAIDTTGLMAGGAQPANPPAGNLATTGADRTTTYTYDNDGNKTSESVFRSYIDGSGNAVQGYVTTTYAYDGEARVISVTENGATESTTYDALGRVTSIVGPQMAVLVSNWQQLMAANPALTLASASLYTMASQVISYTYDAQGNRLTQTQGSTGSTQSVTTYYQYDQAGRMLASVTPLNGVLDWTSSQARYLTYDANGNLLSTASTLDGDDGSTVGVTVANVYDADNQLIYTATTRSNSATPDKVIATQYNAFGEVIATGNGVTTSSNVIYDNDGNRVTANDPKTGQVHSYGYNLAGQMVTDTVPLAASVGGTVTTTNTLDLDGRVIAEQGPSTNAASGQNAGVLHASYDRWGNVLSSTDAAGNTTSYTYNERNQVTSTTEAAVTVVGLDGTATVTTPVKKAGYDLNGNLVESIDEDGNVTVTTLNVLGQKVKAVDGTGATTYVAYDALGNEVADQDGNGNVTFQNVDALGRVVQEGDFVATGSGTRTATWRQAYVLDQNGDHLITYDGIGAAYLQNGDTTDAALHANYYGYDTQGRVIWSQDAAQRAASTSDTHVQGTPGQWTQAPTNANFSQGATGWNVQQGWSTGNFGTGPYGPWTAVFTGYAPNGNGSMVNQDVVPVVPGQTITASAGFIVQGEHGGGAVFITWYDANGNVIASAPNRDIVSAHHGAGISKVTATAPPGAAYATIGINATDYNLSGSAIYCSGVSWNYVPPAGVTSTDSNGSIVVWLPSGSFTQQPSNPDFEDGDTGWDKDAGWTIHTQSNTSNGSWVASFNDIGTGSPFDGIASGTLTNQDRVPVTPGQVISASAQVSLDLAFLGAQASAGIVIVWYDAQGDIIGRSPGNVVSTDRGGAYHATNVTATAPEGAAFAAVAIDGTSRALGTAVVDAVSWNYQYIPSTPVGVVQDTYVYDMDGNLVSKTTADGNTETWQYDAYGRVITHTDLSGAVYNYTYDPNTGELISESDNWSAQAQGQQTPLYVTAPIGTPNSSTDTYYADGLLATQTFSDGSSYSYSYDANGNQTRQEAITVDGNGQAVHTITTTTYDSHNRIGQVVEVNALAGSTVLDETYAYDAAGNRREVKATSNGATQDAWYTYDGDNRVVVSAGSLVNGQIQVTDAKDSYENIYDANGNVIDLITADAAGHTLAQQSHYDSRNELTSANYAVDVTAGGVFEGVEETRTYDADGHVLITETFYALGTTVGGRPAHQVDPDSPYTDEEDGNGGTDVGGMLDTAVIDYYDTVGRLAEEQNFGRASSWAGTEGASAPTTAPGPDATTFGALSLQNEVVYQGANGSAGYDADGDVVAYQYRDASGRIDQYAVTYLRKDDYLQSTTSGINISGTANVRPSTDESVYDTRGNLVAEAQHTQYAGGTVADTVHVFAYDGNGQIIERRDGTATGAIIDQGSTPGLEDQHYAYVNGQQVAHFDDNGTLDILSEVTAFSSGNGGPGGYVVQAGDTLESIAQSEYGNASLWYVIAQANALGGDSQLSLGQRLTIPTVTTNSNSATTFKPYDPGSIVGSTTPSLPVIAPPAPPKHHCNAVAEILVIAVTVVATVVTYGATTDLLGAELGGVMATGAAAGAAAGAVGSIAGQLTGMALGTQNGFDWGQVAEGAIGGAIAGGVTSELGAPGSIFANSNAADGLTSWGDVAQGAANYVGNDIAAKVTGESANFSWAGLVAESLASAASGWLGATPTDNQIGLTSGAYWENLGARALSDVVDREASVALGDNHVKGWAQIGEDVAGNAIGMPIGTALKSDAVQAIEDYKTAQAQAAQAALKANPLTQYNMTGYAEFGNALGNAAIAGMNSPSFSQDFSQVDPQKQQEMWAEMDAEQRSSSDQGMPVLAQTTSGSAALELPSGSHVSELPDVALSAGEQGRLATTTAWPYSYVDSYAINRNDGIATGVDYTQTFSLPDQSPVTATALVAAPEQSYRALSDTDAIFAFTRVGQALQGFGDRVNGLLNGLMTPGVGKAATIAAIAHYQSAYQNGTLGNTVLMDAGNALHQAIMATPVGLIKALNESQTQGGMYQLGGSLFDTATFAAPIAGERLLAEGGDLLQAGSRTLVDPGVPTSATNGIAANIGEPFKPNGLNLNPLSSPSGTQMVRALEAQGLSTDEAVAKAMDLISTGSTPPIATPLDSTDTLIKFVPQGAGFNPDSAFWATREQASFYLQNPSRIPNDFGLPLQSNASAYDVYARNPIDGAVVFQSDVAPTQQGGWIQSGGAGQSLMLDGKYFTPPYKIGTVYLQGH
ncbi:hypothetical protein DVT68_00110 [Dyella solisilvae]|uniref:LysM domain-containing protein n=1 Tax=Dyella solisilvae TaxID=1920168 RepID=A0A370KA50_9GAMM|nr:LysM peptidoglycan-binding domain-containing protein [Dyella solisilvae]RDI99307.1 hypothetical protein DVT68_00110 [Dyella solisilvae]